jgi:dolichyl-phosphate beta-glucosyltransferase
VRPDVSLVVPCFDEGARIDACLDALLAWADARPHLRVECVVVDDGSTDGTRARAEARAAADPRVRLVEAAKNGGKGAALRLGVASAEGDVVVFLDADLAAPVETVDRMLPALQDGVDVVVGSRVAPGAEVLRPEGRLRRVLGRGYLWLARRWLGLGVSDVTCGLKGFRRGSGQRLFAATRSSRWGIDAEVLYLAERTGLVVEEVPVRWSHGAGSAVRLPRDAWRSARELWLVRRRGTKALDRPEGPP